MAATQVRHSVRRAARAVAATLLALAATAAAAADGEPPLVPSAGPGVRSLSVRLDNDSFTIRPHDDRWYTSGFELRWVSETAADSGAARVAGLFCGLAGCAPGAHAYRLASLVHRMYNPSDSDRTEPDPLDRPYAAWLALGLGALVREPDAAHRLELRLGVTGPAALGEPVQNAVHRALGLDETMGWGRQIRPRLGLQLGWASLGLHRWLPGRLDWTHRIGAEAGTLQAAAHAGALLRWGRPPEGPTWPGEPYGGRSDAEAGGRWHLYVGAEGRAIGRDRLIDGPAYGYEPRVRREPFVGDLFAGAALRLSPAWWFEFAMTMRSVDFEVLEPIEAALRPQRFGSVLLRWTP